MDKRDNQEYLNKINSLEKTIAEQEIKMSKMQTVIDEYKSKEQSISSAIIASMEHANQLEASRKKLYSLDIQRSRLMYLRMEQIINELYVRYPELYKDNKLKDMAEKFKSMVYRELSENSGETYQYDAKKQTVVDDPIKKLLRNIVDVFETKKANQNIKPIEQPKQFQSQLQSEFKPQPQHQPQPSSSGFDINEALHPTMKLEDILKVFDLDKFDEDK